MNKIKVLWVSVLLILALSAPVAFAQECTRAPDSGGDAIADLMNNFVQGSCLLDERCDSDMCDAINAWEELPPSIDKVKQAGRMLRRIMAGLKLLPNSSMGVEKLKYNLAKLNIDFELAEIEELPTGIIGGGTLNLFAGNSMETTGYHEINLESMLQEACDVGDCGVAFNQAIRVLEYATLQGRIYHELMEPSRVATQIYVRGLNDRWTAYGDLARGLYPWENLANSMINESRVEEEGFVEPPTWQLLVLHPTANFEYLDDEEELEDALSLELLGFYKWNWGGESGTSIKNRFGGSLLVSYIGEGRGTGYGVNVYLPANLSLGVVRRRGDTSLLLSVDLAKLWTDKDALRKRLLNLWEVN